MTLNTYIIDGENHVIVVVKLFLKQLFLSAVYIEIIHH